MFDVYRVILSIELIEEVPVKCRLGCPPDSVVTNRFQYNSVLNLADRFLYVVRHSLINQNLMSAVELGLMQPLELVNNLMIYQCVIVELMLVLMTVNKLKLVFRAKTTKKKKNSPFVK